MKATARLEQLAHDQERQSVQAAAAEAECKAAMRRSRRLQKSIANKEAAVKAAQCAFHVIVLLFGRALEAAVIFECAFEDSTR